MPDSGQRAWIDQHADADEKQAEQHIAKWTDAGFHLMTELGLAEHHARQKGTKRQRQAQAVGRPGGCQNHQQDREREQFGGTPLGDQMEERAHGPAHGIEDQGKRQHGLGHGPTEFSGKGVHARGCAQHRNQDQERHGRDILKHRNGEAEPTVRGCVLALLGQLPADDGGRGLREDGADDERHCGAQTSQPEQCGHGSRGQGHLRGTQAENLMAHRMQLRQRVVEADREQQEDHAEFGEYLELRDMHGRSSGMGAEDQADQQVTEAGGDMQPLEGDHHHHAHCQQ